MFGKSQKSQVEMRAFGDGTVSVRLDGYTTLLRTHNGGFAGDGVCTCQLSKEGYTCSHVAKARLLLVDIQARSLAGLTA